MAGTPHHAELNQLLIHLGRSLLQYVGESWPWTDSHSNVEQRKLNELVARQQQFIERLAELLVRRDWAIDFGAYPTEYTDLHYVALDYLLDLLILDQEALLADVDRTISVCGDDPEAVRLLGDLRTELQHDLKELRDLGAARNSSTKV